MKLTYYSKRLEQCENSQITVCTFRQEVSYRPDPLQLLQPLCISQGHLDAYYYYYIAWTWNSPVKDVRL